MFYSREDCYAMNKITVRINKNTSSNKHVTSPHEEMLKCEQLVPQYKSVNV